MYIYSLSMYELDEIKNSKGMHMAHINIRSLMNKWENFKENFNNKNIQVLGISETWLNNSLPRELFELSKNYIFYRNDRNWRDLNSNSIKKGGGVGLYVDNNLSSLDTKFAHLHCSNKNIECQWVSISQNHSKLIVIGNMYRPPQGDIDVFIQFLEHSLENLELDRIELYLIGDFNIDFLDKKDPSYIKLSDLIKPLGLRQLYKKGLPE